VVVTADTEIMDAAAGLGASVATESSPTGIAEAIALGLPSDGLRAVLLGDLPALRPDDLAAALESARSHPHAFVADADGTGTTLVTAGPGVEFLHHFGQGSAQRHRDAGLIELPAGDSLRRDVDLPEHLDQLRDQLGPRTAAVLSAPRG
ncbi:MAG: 2-phospho-L-lactate guanylyltransferase, partial [Pseudolysinimonas sp.]